MRYNWQQPDWLTFKYDLADHQKMLFKYAQNAGKISGALNALPPGMQVEVIIDMLVQEAIKTSEIEGEYIERCDVRSSIKNQLGLAVIPEKVRDVRAKNIAAMMFDVRHTFQKPLSQKMLFGWHNMLFNFPLYGKKNAVGQWRKHDDEMQIVSGRPGKLTVHFEAPPSSVVPKEMKAFIKWFNDTAPGQPGEIVMAPIRAAIAHLYFESIHPFEDGNGRIGRVIIEKALSQGLNRQVVMSLSDYFEANKKSYYKALKVGQSSNDITPWVSYFIESVLNAQLQAEEKITLILQKTRYLDQYKNQLNLRQQKVLNRMLKEKPGKFEGGMSAKKYMAITRASKATATRDLQSLVAMGALIKTGSGRSVRYQLSETEA